MKTAKDFQDGHIWFSVINRPPCSTFTRVQRVSCCFSLLLCTMLTSIMFWGIPTDPSEQTMDLGRKQNGKINGENSLAETTVALCVFKHYPEFCQPSILLAGHIEFTWQQVMIGVQSSIIMFPINLLIVSIFRNTRPREKATKTDASNQGKKGRVSPSKPSSPKKESKDITPDTVMKVSV